MHRALLLLPLMSLSFSCTRELTVVRPPPEAEPDFLGPFSGVYRGITGGGDSRASRTVLIQLGNKIVFSPFLLVDGEPRLSMFASVAELPEGGGMASVATDVVLDITEGFWSEGVTCDPTEDLSGLDFPTLFQTVTQRIGECQSAPSTCKAICYVPNLFDVEAGVLGRCLGDGTLCSYPVELSARVGRDQVELLFNQNAVAPPPAYDRLECAARQPDGWQKCTPAGAECQEDWAVCLPLNKLCDFDSRVAGVYQATIELRTEATDDPAPRVIEEKIDLAVAIANNIPAIILFWSDEELGDRLLIGRLEPATAEFRVNDGESPMDAGWVIRDGREPSIEVDGRLVEDATEGLVQVTGTWVESRTGAGGAVKATYALTASRLSGVSVGSSCQSMASCENPNLVCPLGNATRIRASTLFVSDEVGADGCVSSECQRVLDGQRSLCEPLPSCGGIDLGDGTYEAYDMFLSEPSCDQPGCQEPESCVRFACYDESNGPSSAANWYKVGSSCSAGQTAVLRFDGAAGVTIECDGDVACPNPQPACPMGISQDIETALIPKVDDTGCVRWRCEQFFTLDDICSDVTPPTCLASELLLPSIRVVEDEPDCVELVCQPNCDSGDCAGCGLCGPFDVTGCGAGSIRVTEECGCPRTECANPTCPYEPSVCPLGDPYSYQTRLIPEWTGGDCVRFRCDQYYSRQQVCPASVTSCPGGETLVPGPHPTDGCIEYACEPSSGDNFDPTTCGEWVHVGQGDQGRLFLDCEPPPCEPLPPLDCAVDVSGLDQEYTPSLDSLNCLSLRCTQYYDPNTPGRMCSDAVLPSALGCTGADVPILLERPGDGCLEHVCGASCTSTCVDCGGACADPSYPDGCASGEVVVVNPECGACVHAQCQPL